MNSIERGMIKALSLNKDYLENETRVLMLGHNDPCGIRASHANLYVAGVEVARKREEFYWLFAGASALSRKAASRLNAIMKSLNIPWRIYSDKGSWFYKGIGSRAGLKKNYPAGWHHVALISP